MMFKNSKVILAIMMIIIFAFTAGCDPQDAVDQKSADAEKITDQQDKTKESADKRQQENKSTIKIYFANENGTKLVEKTKSISGSGQDKYKAAIGLLITGTKEKGVVAMLPPKTKLRDVQVKNGIAYVDFSRELVKQFNGGSAGEIMLVGSIVNTLTEFPEVKAVQILIEGEIVETISGHMDISEPLKRFEDILKK